MKFQASPPPMSGSELHSEQTARDGREAARLTDIVKQSLGLRIPPTRAQTIERGISAAAAELGCEPEILHRRLSLGLLSIVEKEALIIALTSGESAFFREPRVFEELRKLPAVHSPRIVAGRKRLSVWSAGCSTGEEPYSIAIAVDQATGGSSSWEIEIWATDVNRLALVRAQKGVYRQRDVRFMSRPVLKNYFSEGKDGAYSLSSKIKKMVTFSHHHLGRDQYPSNVDIIFCRNLLIYLDDKMVSEVVAALHAALATRGYLVVAVVEAPLVTTTGLFRGYSDIAGLFVKQ